MYTEEGNIMKIFILRKEVPSVLLGGFLALKSSLQVSAFIKLNPRTKLRHTALTHSSDSSSTAMC